MAPEEETKQGMTVALQYLTSYIAGSVKISTNYNITYTFQETPHCHQYPWQKSHRWIWHFASLPPERTVEEQ